jgi:outer membrane lipoprotein carrier protein
MRVVLMKNILALIWLVCSGLVFAFGPENQLVEKFQQIQTMDAHFQQHVFMNGRRVSTSSGRFMVQRPGRMRWSVEKPHSQLYVANGQVIWTYEPELKQATKRPQSKGIGGTAGLFLSNQPSLWVQRYKVYLSKSNDRTVFELRAKTSKTPFSKVMITFVQNQLTEIEFWDQLGQNSQVKLNKVKMNQAISAKEFQFSPPQHTDIINL